MNSLKVSSSEEDKEEEEHVDSDFIQRMQRKYTTYTDLLELSIPGNMFSIKKVDKVQEEIKESLRKLALSVTSQYQRAKQKKQYDLHTKIKKFHVVKRHVQSVEELEMYNEEFRDLNSCLFAQWKEKYEYLEERR